MPQPSVLITGCSSGIGRALADAFKADGYAVWATARKDSDLAALEQAGFHAVQLDVNDSVALERLAARLNEEIGGLDVLINNAGYGAMGPLLDGGVEAMRKQFETNVFSIVGVTRAFFPLLRRRLFKHAPMRQLVPERFERKRDLPDFVRTLLPFDRRVELPVREPAHFAQERPQRLLHDHADGDEERCQYGCQNQRARNGQHARLLVDHGRNHRNRHIFHHCPARIHTR